MFFITLKASLSMDTVGEQSQSCTLIDAQRQKIERDKTRLKKKNVQRKRLHVLQIPLKLAFK
jgi:hypothetical protein